MSAADFDRFEPSADDPWDVEKAAHLLRRAAFGGPPRELERLRELGFARAVDELVDFADEDIELARLIDETGGPIIDLDASIESSDRTTDELRSSWLFRMAYGRSPLREKLALLWHDHFACQESDEIGPPLLSRQLRLFRSSGAGSFRDLLHQIARDPAMLTFLDGKRNVKEKPNENWARELMELFTLGIDNYSQADVVDVARVFTGWGLSAESQAAFQFHPEHHDASDKLVLGHVITGRSGEAGIDEGDIVLDLLLDHVRCANFVARKMLCWFLEDDPSEELCRSFGEVLKSSGWSLRESLRVLFSSQVFWSRARRSALTKNPVEVVIAAARALCIQNVHLLDLPRVTRSMGMALFHPPSVAGWDLGAHWIHPGAVLSRLEFAHEVANVPHSRRTVVGAAAMDVDALVDALERTAEQTSDAMARRVLGQRLEPARIASIAARVERRAALDRRKQIRAAVEGVLSSPEFALA
jgi:uncharacterized protein (DUF1800 family)